ncbi:hypothetical protein BC567DRAFT_250067 [Phyllosticta citribraziliensis]
MAAEMTDVSSNSRFGGREATLAVPLDAVLVKSPGQSALGALETAGRWRVWNERGVQREGEKNEWRCHGTKPWAPLATDTNSDSRRKQPARVAIDRRGAAKGGRRLDGQGQHDAWRHDPWLRVGHERTEAEASGGKTGDARFGVDERRLGSNSQVV